ncbi:PKD domain-containing protein [Truepera radiovictrix]|uniref:PKD domain containing protein n=1 Tax=Truepera radiovictrix (strain DSM 17093 / CIP 108686 / LMG 22925 / RQ-24) TaxID=649638 RepID=D7CUF7_TRURR|nr:PKD domain-containing protein [Truepera radiovictrix]ADI15742.1 PKD domain containing protein [Truepera radiovictrix DSM 17093]WMT58633.1 PKD domain-containing protein [Truepera radiovictrix]
MRPPFRCALLLVCALSACSSLSPQPTAGSGPAEEPAVAIAQIGNPNAEPLPQVLVDARAPRNGPLLVPADTQYDPVTQQTTSYPVAVFVTASDSERVESVELFVNGASMGRFVRGTDPRAFGNPFVFPAPESGRPSVPLPGAASGLVTSQLQAVVRNAAGQQRQTAVLEVQADGSRPDFDFSVSGHGASATGPVQLSASANDPESGIASFAVFVNGQEQALDPASPASFSAALELPAGSYTVRLEAVNGVGVPNATSYTFRVAERPSDGAPTDPPTAPPAPPTDPTDPPAPPTDPTDPPAPPTDPTDPPTPPTDPTDPPTDPPAPPTTPPEDPDNRRPEVALAAEPTAGEAPLTVTFTANAKDYDGDPLTFRWDFGDGTVLPATTREQRVQTHTYTAPGSYTATVTVEDGRGGVGRASVTVTVTAGGGGNGGGDDGGAPPAPPSGPTIIAGDDAAVTLPGEPVVINVLANDASSAGELTLVGVSEPVAGGVAEVVDGGFVRYTPPPELLTTDAFTYTIEDTAGNRATGRVLVRIEARR